MTAPDPADDQIADAKSCIKAASFVPAGPIYDEYRGELLFLAGEILDEVSSRQIGTHGWVDGYNENAAYAVQVWDACLKFTSDPSGGIRERKAWALCQSGDFESAYQLVATITKLRQNDPRFAYNMACLTSDRQDADASLRWFNYAVQLGFDSIAIAKTDPDLAFMRARKASEFSALTTVQGAWKINWGIFNDDLVITNNSPFALTHVRVKATITSNGKSWAPECQSDVIKPGETFSWPNVLSVPGDKIDPSSAVAIECDQNRGAPNSLNYSP